MSLIFRIAAGVIIGLLVVQLVIMQMYPASSYEDMNKRMTDGQNYADRIMSLDSAIRRYYRKHKKLPTDVKGLECTRRMAPQGEAYCAEWALNGVFYLKYKDSWASLRPSVINGKVTQECRAELKYLKYAPELEFCSEISSVGG